MPAHLAMMLHGNFVQGYFKHRDEAVEAMEQIKESWHKQRQQDE